MSKQERAPRLRRYLTRPTPTGPRHLDHGVLAVGVAGGFPHLYRVQLSLGLLDHLTLGATAHWVRGQSAPNWAPHGSIAFWRRGWFEIGASYRQTLHPPPRADDDPQTPAFPQRTHYMLAGMTFSQAWYSAGFDVGVANRREADESMPDEDQAWVRRNRLGGGIHFRIGTRRLGLTLQAQLPELTAEALVDVRFGLFEMRSKGRWLDY